MMIRSLLPVDIRKRLAIVTYLIHFVTYTDLVYDITNADC